jgi:hypothetical protein
MKHRFGAPARSTGKNGQKSPEGKAMPLAILVQ